MFIILFSLSADFSAKERLNISLEYDTNVYKSPLRENDSLISDYNLRLQSDLTLKYSSKKHLFRSNIINGGKLFLKESDANMLVNQGEVSYLYKSGSFAPETGIELKDTTTAQTRQDYTLIRPFAAMNYLTESVYLKLLAGYEKFIFDFSNNYSYESPVAGLISSFNIDENLSINLNYLFRYMMYDSFAYRKLGNIEKDTLLTERTGNKRKDTNHSLIARLNYESDLLISLTYNPEINSSNSAGESVFRQRFQISMTSMLFFKIYLNMLLSVMISSFKDGILISDELLLINDNENRNYIIFKLSREVYKKTMVELKYSYYYSEFSNYITQFSRSVVSAGVCLKF
ncbi:MAG: hypothetical protein N3B13_03545 [Deltaproteobacteria bacterium]|nr:hypothetical protein [Deltaproteobacteria bacterium]